MSGAKLKLRCLVWPDDKPHEHIVPVKIDDDDIVGDLKDMIKHKHAPMFDKVAARDLVLWKCSGLPNDDNLEQTLKNLKFDGSDNRLVRLTSAIQQISEHFGDRNLSNEPIHILVEAHPHATLSPSSSKLSENVTPPSKRRRRYSPLYSPPPQPSPHTSPRTHTVSALHDRLQEYHFIQVRGTPASGKTTLAKLLVPYIAEREPDVKVIFLDRWPSQEVKDVGGYSPYLKEKGWVEGEKTVFILDEAQLSYCDGSLWGTFFKAIPEYRGRCRAIVFASYGSPSTEINMEGTPIRLAHWQRVSLLPIDHKDGLPPVGLLFTRDEFDLLVSKEYPNPPHHFHSSFFDALYNLTAGHIGAISDSLHVIAAHQSYRLLKLPPPRVYTWDTFLEEFSPRDLMIQLGFKTIFARGLPEDHKLQNPATARVLSAVLSESVVTVSYFTSQADRDALDECFRKGWLHTDNIPEVGQPGEYGFFFASPLHRWYVEWKLFDTVAAIPFEAVDIYKFVVDVVSKFSPRLLSAERRIGPACIQRPPEAQYQDEFYRSCHKCSNGSLVTLSEFGTAKGRVDFYIRSKKWGVELLRNGDPLSEHCSRFSTSGMYTKTLPLSDHIILDCRTTSPKLPHPNLPKLYHVIFNDTFETVSILNNKLEHIDEIRLLAAS